MSARSRRERLARTNSRLAENSRTPNARFATRLFEWRCRKRRPFRQGRTAKHSETWSASVFYWIAGSDQSEINEHVQKESDAKRAFTEA